MKPAHRHTVRNISFAVSLLLVGVTLPLSITKGNEISGGNATLVALWLLSGMAALVWVLATDTVYGPLTRSLRRAAGIGQYLPRISVQVDWPGSKPVDSVGAPVERGQRSEADTKRLAILQGFARRGEQLHAHVLRVASERLHKPPLLYGQTPSVLDTMMPNVWWDPQVETANGWLSEIYDYREMPDSFRSQIPRLPAKAELKDVIPVIDEMLELLNEAIWEMQS